MVTVSYECFERLIRELRAAGHATPAAELEYLLRTVAWTSGSELLGALGEQILRIQKATPIVADDLSETMEESLAMVRRVWPDIR